MKNKTHYDMVVEFHNKFNHPVEEKFVYKNWLHHLRNRLVNGECVELTDTCLSPQEHLKELCDILYVVYGYAVTYGWDINTAFNRVHKSNMSKLGDDGKPILREDGKVMKGPNYKEPVLDDLV